MNYKRIITAFFAAATALCSVGCADDGEVKDFETELNLSFTSYTAPKAGGTEVLDIECNGKWDITQAQDVEWFELSKMSGENDGEVTLTVDENKTIETREVTFTVTSSEVSYDFLLTQRAGDETLVVTPTFLEDVVKGGATETITVKNNSTWSAEAVFAADETAWFELQGDFTDVTGDGEFEVVIGQNEDAEIRSAKIVFTGAMGGSTELVVSQSVADATLEISSQNYDSTDGLGSAEASFTIDVASNTSWTFAELTFEDGETAWFTVDPMTGSHNGAVTVKASANTSAAERSYTLSVSYEGLETPETFEFKQAGAEATLTLAPETTEFAYDSEGGEQEFTVTTNDEYTVTIPEAATWLTKEDTEAGFKLVAVENDSEETTPLEATVVVACVNAPEEKVELKFTQSTMAMDNLFSVNVETIDFDADGAVVGDGATADVVIASYIASWKIETVKTTEGDDDLSWLTGIPANADEATTEEFTVVAAENGAITKRGATITLTADDPNSDEDIVKTIEISQAGGGVTLSSTTSTETTLALGNAAAESTAEINVTTNDTWTVTLSDEAFEADPATGTGDGSFVIKTKTANGSVVAKPATATVTVKNDDTKSLVFNVEQAAAAASIAFDGIAETSKDIELASEGGNDDVVVTSNDELVVTIPAEATWLTYTNVDGTITFTAEAANSTTATLTAAVTIACKSDATKTLTVNVSQPSALAAGALVLDTETIDFDLFGYSTVSAVNVSTLDDTAWTVESITNVAGTEGWLTVKNGATALAAGAELTGSQKLTFEASVNGAGAITMTAETSTVNTTSSTYKAAEERSATVVLKCGSKTQTITISQNSTDVPHFKPTINNALPDTAGYSADGGEFEIEFTGTSTYRLLNWGNWYSMTATNAIATYSNGVTCAGNGTVTLKLLPNPHSVMRGGWGQYKYEDGAVDEKGALVAYCDDTKAYSYGQLYPYQAAGAPVLNITTASVPDLYGSHNTGSISVESNISWTASSSESWLTISSGDHRYTDGIYDDTAIVAFSAEDNSGADRTAKIILTPSALKFDGTTARTDVTLPEVVEITVTQRSSAYVVPASLTAYVPYVSTLTDYTEYNTVVVTADSEFVAGQTFDATQFALSYTNDYAGSVANSASASSAGTIAISSITLDETDATKIIIKTSENVYNTDALTLTYSGTDLAMANTASFPKSTLFPATYAEILNNGFETVDSSAGWALKNTNNTSLSDLNSDFSKDDGTGNKVLEFDSCAGDDATGKVYIASPLFTPDNELGKVYKFSYKVKIVSSTSASTTLESSQFFSYLKDWAGVPSGAWGSRWMTSTIWTDMDSAVKETWITKTQDFIVALNPNRTYEGLEADHKDNALLKSYVTRDNTDGASLVLQYDDFYFGNAQPRQ